MTIRNFFEPRMSPQRLLVVAMVLLAALWLGHRALQVNMQFICSERQWPDFAHCETEQSDMAAVDQLTGELVRLRARIAANPGDAWAVAQLAQYASLPDETLGQSGAQLLASAARVAPHHTEVIRQQALRALTQQDWALAVPHLVALGTLHGDTEAVRALARLVSLSGQDPQLLNALRQALQKESTWLDTALRFMPGEKLPLGPAMPLVSTLAMSGELRPATGLIVIRQLKSEGLWLDAHALWMQLWKTPVGLLFNGDFEQRFVKQGFDWEVGEENTARAGVQVDRVSQGERGQVLKLLFTGRAMRTPLVRQDLLLPTGSYRLEGEYQSNDLRSEEGLTWVLSCAQGGQELGRSPALKATGRSWQTLQLQWTMPASCQGAVLALQPQAAYESGAGMRGEMLFDRMRLTRVDPGTKGSH